MARIEGSDPAAPTLCLMGHTDVVPVNPATWTRDPFGGELVKGEVWGRGALDMLNITASQAVVLKALAKRGWRPRGTLVYLACADEEAGGALGAGHVCKKHWDSLRADYLLTENGGTVSEHNGELNVTVHVGEKGVAWRRLRVKGTPGHGSMPYGADNALVKAAQVVTRLADYRPSPYVGELWHALRRHARRRPGGEGGAGRSRRASTTTIAHLAPGLAKYAWSATHTTFSPNMCRGRREDQRHPRRGRHRGRHPHHPRRQRGRGAPPPRQGAGPDLFEEVEIEKLFSKQASVSPTGTPLWDVLGKVVDAHYPGAKLLPRLIVGFTDAPYFREHGAIAYGFGLFSRTLTAEAMSGRFHGNDERIDVESLALTTQAWLETCELFLG